MRHVFLVLIFLLPFQTRYFLISSSIGGEFFEYGSFTVYATEILLWFLVLYELCVRIAHKRSGGHSKIFPRILRLIRKRPVLVSGALFFLYAALSFLWSIDREQTFFYMIRFTEALLLIWLIRTGGLSKRRIFSAFILGVLVQSVLGIYQFFTQEVFESTVFGIASHVPDTRGVAVVETELRRYLRAYGGLPHPNIFGGWILAGLLTLIALVYDSALRHHASLRPRITSSLLIAYAILFTSLILTFSRSAWLAFFLGGGLLFVYGLFNKGIRRGAINALVITAALSIFLGILLKEPLTERGKGIVFNRDAGRLERKSAEERETGFREAWILYKKNPLFGSGLGTYATALHRAYPDRPSYAIQPAHATPVLIAEELGALGMLLAFLFLYRIAAFLLRRRQVRGLAFFLVFASIGAFDHYLWTLYSGIMLIGFCFGACIVLNENE